jgi:peptide methionine sulfoxide reductase MsrA
VTFNRDKWTYEELLDYFFGVHYPSDPRYAGTQYRSAIFCHTEEQKQLAEAACKKKGALGKFVAVEMASDFYRAEEYHQKYVEKQTAGIYGF